MPFMIPKQVDDIINEFDQQSAPLDLSTLVSRLSVERVAMKERSASSDEDFGLWCEMVPSLLSTNLRNSGENPWNSYFRPFTSITYEGGTSLFHPQVDEVTSDAVDHWAERARQLKHPVLRARYADVVWELGRLITNKPKRDIEMARIACDAYIEAVQSRLDSELIYAFDSARRAIELAVQINDQSRIDRAKSALLGLHSETMSSDSGHMWSCAFDYLSENKRAGATDVELGELAADLEVALARASNSTDRTYFDPHSARRAANLLTKHYEKAGRRSDVQRCHAVVARAFEFHAGLGSAMLGAAFLQDSLAAFKAAGMPDESERIRVAMEQKIRESHDEMVHFSDSFETTQAEIDSIIAELVVDSAPQTLINIALYFLPRVAQMEEQVRRAVKDAPLFAAISQEIMSGDHVAGRVGSVADDLPGRVLVHTAQVLQLYHLKLRETISAAVERHGIQPADLVWWVNKAALLEEKKLSLLHAGIQAWFNRDYYKALHLTIPQIESALRSMVDKVGRPITKAASNVPGVSVAINMSDILYNTATIEALGPLGPHLALYMKAVFADPRGLNLRNKFAHGLLDAEDVDERSVLLIVFGLLIIALWQRPESSQSK